MDMKKRFVDTFIPGRNVTVTETSHLAEMYYTGVMVIDTQLAMMALKAKSKGVKWISGGVEFLANHEEGHWALGEPNPYMPGTRNGCPSEGKANLYAFAKSGDPIEDYSSMLALLGIMQYQGMLDRGWTLNNVFYDLGKKGVSAEAAFAEQTKGTMAHHEVGRYLRDDALAEIREKAQRKFLELKPLLRRTLDFYANLPEKPNSI